MHEDMNQGNLATGQDYPMMCLACYSVAVNPSYDLKDLFSAQSTDYARFRPTYPHLLFQHLASLLDQHDLAWDCGTGNVQTAVFLAETFERVIATDPSAKQISGAKRHPKVDYRVGTAERSTLPNASVDLITAAQAFHWFKSDVFFLEADRVLKPGAVLAFWCYELCLISPEVDVIRPVRWKLSLRVGRKPK